MISRPARTTGFESCAPLAVSQVDATTWETTAALVFHSRTGRVLNVPVGSRTDWASILRIVAWLIAKMTGAAAALGHDHCWRVLCPAGEMTYREADYLLEEMLAALDAVAVETGEPAGRIPAPTRWLMWCAVRWASILTRPGGAKGAWRDLPRMVAITIPGLVLASPAVVLLPSMALFAAINYMSATFRDRGDS